MISRKLWGTFLAGLAPGRDHELGEAEGRFKESGEDVALDQIPSRE